MLRKSITKSFTTFLFIGLILCVFSLTSQVSYAQSSRSTARKTYKKKYSRRKSTKKYRRRKTNKARRYAVPYIKSKYAAIIVEYPSGDVLFSENADKLRYPASLTKVMTLYLLFKALHDGNVTMNSMLKVSKYAANQEPTRLGVKPGKPITVRKAIFALVAKSANDVAAVVAENLGGSVTGFAKLMTEQAHALGMNHTTFYNASGLPHTKQKTTAADLAKLAMAMLRDYPNRYHFFKTQKFYHNGFLYRSHNRMLKKYPGCDGMKTGFIRASGFNIITSAKRHGQRLIAVVMGGLSSYSRDRHTTKLLDQAFLKYKQETDSVEHEMVTNQNMYHQLQQNR